MINKDLLHSRGFLIAAVVLMGLLLRVWAAWQLPVDFDEPVYVQGANDLAELILDVDIGGVIDYDVNREHPPLVRLFYSLPIVVTGGTMEWDQALFFSRLISVLFGTFAVLLMASIDPLAGALFAVQTLVVKYTGQAYLEALPLFAALLAVFALLNSKRARDRWFWFSAAALGITAAGKYSYFPILVVVLYIFFGERKYRPLDVFLYLGAALLIFWMLDPVLWRDPVNRLLDSALFHPLYSQGATVQNSGYPWYQPIMWLSRSWAYEWHPGVFFYFGLDGLIFLLGLAGIRYEWAARRWVVVWMASGLLLLLLWPTKWPQYTLVLLPAFCLSASTAVPRLFRWLKDQEEYFGWFSDMIPRPSRIFWIVGALFVGVIALGWLVNTIIVGINHIGWTNINAGNTYLPSDRVYDVTAGADDAMYLATENGAVIWSYSSGEDVLSGWEIFNTQNSDLPDDRVLSVAVDQQGAVWFGTRTGLAKYDGTNWQVYQMYETGLSGEEVHAIAIDDMDRVWIGTNAGAAVYDGITWTSYSQDNSGLIDDLVLSIEFQPQTESDTVWFGTREGVSRFDLSNGSWSEITPESSGLGAGGVPDLLYDSLGRMWIATLGGGVSVWDGDTLIHYRVSNSELPYNIVQTISETEPGIFWIATAVPNSPGGQVSNFDGTEFRTYRSGRTGYTGSETVTITVDTEGRIWFGTLTAGIDLYEPRD